MKYQCYLCDCDGIPVRRIFQCRTWREYVELVNEVKLETPDYILKFIKGNK